jgi:hypothetical protein
LGFCKPRFEILEGEDDFFRLWPRVQLPGRWSVRKIPAPLRELAHDAFFQYLAFDEAAVGRANDGEKTPSLAIRDRSISVSNAVSI